MRFLVIDDHPIVLDAVRIAIAHANGASQVESALDLAEGIAILENDGPFDLVLLDLSLPGFSGVQALEAMRESHPEQPVVVFSGDASSARILAALDLGAMGYIPKTASREEILGALSVVASGGVFVPKGVMRSRSAANAIVPGVHLTGRQSDVLWLMLRGLSNKQICRQLELSENTVKDHVSAVLRALNVSNRTEAVIVASELGIRPAGTGGEVSPSS